MAVPPKPRVIPARETAKEAGAAFKFDAQRRINDQNKILSADDLSGVYSLTRQLFTTIDGGARPLTMDDLIKFRANRDAIVASRKKKGKAIPRGITPKEVIALSWPDDRERANSQIRQGFPQSMKGGVIRFITNSGPNSKVSRHAVYVDLLMWNAVISSPAKPIDIAKEALRGAVSFDCDCERHTFWYRYIATIGNYNYGRPEDGFPRVRNPNLRGVACKHVLRIMQLLQSSPTIRAYVAKQIERARSDVVVKKQDVSVRDIKKMAEELKKEYRHKTILTPEEKRAKREAQPAYQKAKAKAEADLDRKTAAKAKEREKRAQEKASKDSVKAALAIERNIKKMVELGGMTQAAADVMLAALKKGK